jgi:hypothetical protein
MSLSSVVMTDKEECPPTWTHGDTELRVRSAAQGHFQTK